MGKLPASDWNTYEEATREIVDELNENTSWRLQVTIVIAGTIGDERGIFDSVGRMHVALTRQCALAGSGGIFAGAAEALATQNYSNADGAMGGDLLRRIVEAGVRADEWSGKPIWRIDFGERVSEPYRWIE